MCSPVTSIGSDAFPRIDVATLPSSARRKAPAPRVAMQIMRARRLEATRRIASAGSSCRGLMSTATEVGTGNVAARPSSSLVQVAATSLAASARRGALDSAQSSLGSSTRRSRSSAPATLASRAACGSAWRERSEPSVVASTSMVTPLLRFSTTTALSGFTVAFGTANSLSHLARSFLHDPQ